MAVDAYSKLKPGGRFICSASFLAREEAVRVALLAAGFELLEGSLWASGWRCWL